jgi:diguanylate cyclase (GGDEF)-like protein
MWPNFRYACFTIPLVALGDSIFLVTNPMLSAPRATVFSAQIWTAAGLSLLASYWMERQERVGFLLRLRVESQNTELARLSTMDSLTGIYNRRRFDSEFRSCWERCIHKAQSMALLMIDLDHFKSLNDRHGHALGDAVLTQVAKTLRDALRGEHDLVARYGGEEFVVILPNRSLGNAIKIAERLCAAVRAVVLPVPRAGLSVRTTISIGAASVLPTSLSGAASLLQDADAALYRAKADGRDRVWPPAATAK